MRNEIKDFVLRRENTFDKLNCGVVLCLSSSLSQMYTPNKRDGNGINIISSGYSRCVQCTLYMEAHTYTHKDKAIQCEREVAEYGARESLGNPVGLAKMYMCYLITLNSMDFLAIQRCLFFNEHQALRMRLRLRMRMRMRRKATGAKERCEKIGDSAECWAHFQIRSPFQFSLCFDFAHQMGFFSFCNLRCYLSLPVCVSLSLFISFRPVWLCLPFSFLRGCLSLRDSFLQMYFILANTNRFTESSSKTEWCLRIVTNACRGLAV